MKLPTDRPNSSSVHMKASVFMYLFGYLLSFVLICVYSFIVFFFLIIHLFCMRVCMFCLFFCPLAYTHVNTFRYLFTCKFVMNLLIHWTAPGSAYFIKVSPKTAEFLNGRFSLNPLLNHALTHTLRHTPLANSPYP